VANGTQLAGIAGTIHGSNVDASREAGEPNHADTTGGTSVWYRWTAPADGTAVFDTCGSSFDTLIGVYTGADVAHLTRIAGNTDATRFCAPQSRVVFSATTGTTYSIAVDGTRGPAGPATGNITLTWTPGATIVDLDTCGSSFDTLIGVYTGADVAHLTRIAGNTDATRFCAPQSRVVFSATTGTTYSIAVDGTRGPAGPATGNITLTWTPGATIVD